MRLNGKVAIITGGGSGQGKEAVKLFAKEGSKVVIAEWNKETGEDVEQEVTAAGHEAFFHQTDVSNEESIKELVQTVREKFGKIDILFNNAGIGYSSNSRYKMASLIETPLEDWNAILGINLNSVYLMSKHVLPVMIKQNEGNIINNASMNALVGESGADAYTAAKGGIVALTRVMAVDYGRNNIRVNCICPGGINTPMIAEVLNTPKGQRHFSGSPLGRVGEPEEIAAAALFLASSDSSYMTGHIMPVDGGWYAK